MYIKPKYFREEEFFSPSVIAEEIKKGSFGTIWRLIDSRIIWTADKIREHFCGIGKTGNVDVMIMNDYLWGGKNKYRGYRSIDIDIIRDKNKFSQTSQHCFGRGIDYKFKHTTVDEVRNDILNNQDEERYQYITAVELDVTWNHNDVRSWNKGLSGIFAFRQ